MDAINLTFPSLLACFKELVAMGLASPHHIYPNSGWVSFYIQEVDDVPNLIKLLRLNYDRLTTKRRSNSSKESAEVGANITPASAPSGQQSQVRAISINNSGNSQL